MELVIPCQGGQKELLDIMLTMEKYFMPKTQTREKKSKVIDFTSFPCNLSNKHVGSRDSNPLLTLSCAVTRQELKYQGIILTVKSLTVLLHKLFYCDRDLPLEFETNNN